MTRPLRLLSGSAKSPANDDHWPIPGTNDSDIVITLAALLCALICVLGLIAVARCAWIRHLSGRGGSAPPPAATARNPPAPTSNKGLKKKILRSLPKVTFTGEPDSQLSDCAICLAEFVTGDETRVLPQCGHVFHVACIDTWFGSHSSCPSCRKVLVVSRCQKCGDLTASSSTGPGSESRSKEREDAGNRFLP